MMRHYRYVFLLYTTRTSIQSCRIHFFAESADVKYNISFDSLSCQMACFVSFLFLYKCFMPVKRPVSGKERSNSVIIKLDEYDRLCHLFVKK